MTKRNAPPLATVAQVASELDMSVRSVLRRIAKGDIMATKIGDGRTSAYVIEQAEFARIKRAQRASAKADV